MGLIGLVMACYGGVKGILAGLTKPADQSSRVLCPPVFQVLQAFGQRLMVCMGLTISACAVFIVSVWDVEFWALAFVTWTQWGVEWLFARAFISPKILQLSSLSIRYRASFPQQSLPYFNEPSGY